MRVVNRLSWRSRMKPIAPWRTAAVCPCSRPWRHE